MQDLVGFHNYLRLTLLLNEGTRILQQTFRDKYKQLNGGQEWGDGPACGKNFSQNHGKKYFSQAQKIQKSLIKKGKICDWDISMLCSILDTPEFGTTSARRKIFKDLRDIRNKLAHLADISSSTTVSTSEFLALWTKLSGVIISLGGDQPFIDLIKTAKEISGVTFEHPGSTAVLSPENQERLRKLKEEGSSAVTDKSWDVAIRKYTLALNLFGLSDVERGNLLSNRSFAQLKLFKEKKAENGTTDDKELSLLSEGALEDARKVIELRPNWWKGYAQVGLVFHAKGEWNSAMVLLSRALALSPGQTEVIKAPDESRYEAHYDTIQQHLDPASMLVGRQECLDKLTREIPSGKFPNLTADDLTKLNKIMMNSSCPQLRARASVYFAHHYLHGIDGPLDYKMAAQLFAKGAAGGDAEGIYNLGRMYQRGRGVAKDLTRAVELFEEAAAKPPKDKFTNGWDIGVAAAEHALGEAYHNGFGTPIDYVKAVEWYQKASKHGVSNSDNNLGVLYSEGRDGVPKNMTKAMQYWELAASRGNALAMESMAWHFLQFKDPDKAEMWFQRSLDSGNMNSVLHKSKFEEALNSVRNCQGCPVHFFPNMMSLMDQIRGFKGPLDNHVFSQGDQSLSPNDKNLVEDDDQQRVKPESKNRTHPGFIQAQCTNPKRIEVVQTHRKRISNFRQFEREDGDTDISNTAIPFFQQKAPEKLSALKDITLDLMDPTKDHVYSGHVTRFTIIEDPIMTRVASVHTVVRDDNFNFQHCYFYNFEKGDRTTKFLYGTKISIVNPYFRLTIDRNSGIRVDDPGSVIFQGRDETLCRFCGKSGATDRCSRCKRAFYCNRRCQASDWKLLKHKHICVPELLGKL